MARSEGGGRRRLAWGGILILVPAILVVGGMLFPAEVCALPAFARKYKVPCSTCHTTFPRLNEYGEQFHRNGYQNPDNDEPDGDTQGKKAYGDHLVLDTDVSHWMSFRFSADVFNFTRNKELREGDVLNGEERDNLDFADTKWVQIFAGGTLFKNVSIFVENEITSSTAKFSWYYIGFQNLFDTSLVNFHVGRLSATNFAPVSDRLMQVNVGAPGVMRIKSSNGFGQASRDLRTNRHGIMYYGYQGPYMWYAGVDNGPSANHPIDKPGSWAGVKYTLPESLNAAFAGSSIGVHGDRGTDTKNSTLATMAENNYSRIMPSCNIRWNDKVDLQAAYVIGHEDNWNLSAGPSPNNDIKINFRGERVTASYYYSPNWAVAVHYDHYEETDHSSQMAPYEFLYLPVVTYLPRENWRFSLYPGYDLDRTGERNNTIYLNIETAF